VIQDPLLRTLPVGLSQFSYGEAGSRWELIMTGASIATVPVLIGFAIFQRQIIRGVALTGVERMSSFPHPVYATSFWDRNSGSRKSGYLSRCCKPAKRTC